MQTTFATKAAFFVATEWAGGIKFVVCIAPDDASAECARYLEQLAAFGEKADVAALKGWRKDIFGEDALKMLNGKIALSLEGREVVAKDIA